MNRNIIMVVLAALVAVCCAAAGALATDDVSPETVLRQGIEWLVAQQNTNGYWSNPEFPALTALPLWALVKGGYTNREVIDKAVQYILACAHPDGSIWSQPAIQQKGGGLVNYNTAICMVALHAVGDAALVPYIQRARTFLAGNQHLGDDIYRGGMGYDPDTGRPYADLSNSSIAYEAMRLTENVEDLRRDGEKKADLDWRAAQEFIQRVQNRPESNDQPWADDDPEQKGGFIYKPDASQAGTLTNAAGKVCFRSYGSMTYAGLLSFIYAGADPTDPRVTAAFDWSVRHWSLAENPGMGQQGLYYFYNVLSKALALYGKERFTGPDGREIAWRGELVNKLVELRRPGENGTVYWVNSTGRWWESDPVLVTSYALLSLEHALRK